MVWAETLLSVIIISAVSLAGLLTIPFSVLRRHGVLFGLIALSAGTLIGDAFFHLLPESVELWEGEVPLVLGMLFVGGFLVFYGIESALRIGHAHGESHHEPHDVVIPKVPAPAAKTPPGKVSPTLSLPKAAAAVSAPRPVQPAHAHPRPAQEEPGIKPFGVLNLVGDAVHNFLDGIVVAAAFLVDVETGIATAVAVAIHEIPQEFGDFGVLLRAGFRPIKAILFNVLSAVFAILGAVLLLLLSFETEVIEKFALPLVAGGFLYIAAADLIPELHHHTRPRYIPLVIGLLVLGLAIMVGLTFLEPEHAHP